MEGGQVDCQRSPSKYEVQFTGASTPGNIGSVKAPSDHLNVGGIELDVRNNSLSERRPFSYDHLFNLEPLLQLQLPGESQTSEEEGAGAKHLHGKTSKGAEVGPTTRQRRHVRSKYMRPDPDQSKRDGESGSEAGEGTVTEEQYRDMLGKRLLARKRARLEDAIAARTTHAAQVQAGLSSPFYTSGKAADTSGQHQVSASVSRGHDTTERLLEGNQEGQTTLVPKAESLDDETPGRHGSGILDLGGRVKLLVPPFFDYLGPTLSLPSVDDIIVSEGFLNGRMNSSELATLAASDPLARWSHGSLNITHWEAGLRAGDRSGQGVGLQEEEELLGEVKLPFGSLVGVASGDDEDEAETSGSEDKVVGNPQTPAETQKLLEQASGIKMEREDLGKSSEKDIAEALEAEESDPGEELQIGPESLRMLCKIIRRKKKVQSGPAKDPAEVEEDGKELVLKKWQAIAKKDIAKHVRLFSTTCKRQVAEAKRTAETCQREVRQRCLRSQRAAKQAAMRTRRLARDMLLFYKRVDREAVDQKKREEREIFETRKREEELREARRQQQRLNFLLTQTELYSHFMRNKLAGTGDAPADSAAPGAPAGGPPLSAEEEAEMAELKAEAERAAAEAAAAQRQKLDSFDTDTVNLRLAAEAFAAEGPNAEDLDLLNPTTMPTTSTVAQPRMFKGHLKEYQLKGLQWLVNLYEQGLNGILADEMGLGKTIQSMSFLAHLAEEKGIWGPFLVVAPASTLPNWADELARFVPDFKILPYWGGLNERVVLRKNFNPKRLYKREAVFHVLVTSYQLLVGDEKYFRRIKWQYMLLDEAQAIKSASSLRWKTLLSFNCRNRLLLTGTPIQNSMAELWALLHFIMPTLFDSHEQFNEWFSRGIESHAENGGTLNEHQLSRLHAILKPFMLRRVKKDVESEMSGKREVVVPCTLTARQWVLYQGIKNKISINDLFEGGSGPMNEKRMLHLMNLVIQLRKVCNHPELFERNEARSSYSFTVPAVALNPPAFGQLEDVHYPGYHNPVQLHLPKLVFREGTFNLPEPVSGTPQGFQQKWVQNRLSIFSAENVHCSIFKGRCCDGVKAKEDEEPASFSGTFGFTRLLNLSPAEVSFLARATVLQRWMFHLLRGSLGQQESWLQQFRAGKGRPEETSSRSRAIRRLLDIPQKEADPFLKERRPTSAPDEPYQALVASPEERLLMHIKMLRSVRELIPTAQAPLVSFHCSDRSFAYQWQQALHEPWTKRLLTGVARTWEGNGPFLPPPSPPFIADQHQLACLEGRPLLAPLIRVFSSSPPVQTFDFSKMLSDSGKLKALDILLRDLRRGGHRVLIFAQMTKMINILEDYMIYRRYKYLRLDGSSSITDRRDMVKDFQNKQDHFVFLLSTRAGGMGINLTAADTVIFYESDWNPTMDLQAMDRAHRLGQTKEVVVYRMICTNTVEEKIVKRAAQKNTVQQLVMTGGNAQADIFEPDEVMGLLLDDQELEKQLKSRQDQTAKPGKTRNKKAWDVGSSSTGPRGLRMVDDGSELAFEATGEGRPGTPGGGSEGPPSRTPETNTTSPLRDPNAAEGPSPGPSVGQKRRPKLVEGKPPRPPKMPRLRGPREKKSANGSAPGTPGLTNGESGVGEEATQKPKRSHKRGQGIRAMAAKAAVEAGTKVAM